MEIDLDLTIVAKRTARAIREGWPITFNEGGSSSSKTYSEVQILVLLCHNIEFRRKILSEHWAYLLNKPLRCSIVSHSLPHIKRGAYRDFKTIMTDLHIWNEDRWRATDFVYTFEDGSYIELFGLEDPGKAKGPRRDLLLVNEGNLITKALFDQLAMRTKGPIVVDLNPSDFNCWCYTAADDPRNKRLHSTYKDNIQNLAQAQVNFIEAFKNLPDDFLWKVYGLGERGAAKELIYTNWKMYSDPPPSGDVFYGLDFGYTNPCAMVRITHYEGSNYIEEVLYQSGLTVPELIQRVKHIVPGSDPIYADSAEPKSIEELYRAGFNVHSSDKDVWAGIVKMKSYPLLIQANSKNLISEIQSYKWKKDKNDEILEEPVKAHDHILDAARYGVHTHLTKPTINFFSV